jgi:hypothetical protein
MLRETKVATAFLISLLILAFFIYLHWNGFLNSTRPPLKVGTCAVFDEEFPDMTSVIRIETIGKTRVLVSYVCTYARTKGLYAKDMSMIRRYYVEVPCECKEDNQWTK